jgi:hypothetical protein
MMFVGVGLVHQPHPFGFPRYPTILQTCSEGTLWDEVDKLLAKTAEVD